MYVNIYIDRKMERERKGKIERNKKGRKEARKEGRKDSMST